MTKKKGKAKDIIDTKMNELEEEHEQRLTRCVPIAKNVLRIILDSDPYIGDLNVDNKDVQEAVEKYEEIAAKILTYFLEIDLPYIDKEFIFQLAMQALEQTKIKTVNAVSMSYDRASGILFGKDSIDVTMNDIHQVLIKDTKK